MNKKTAAIIGIAAVLLLFAGVFCGAAAAADVTITFKFAPGEGTAAASMPDQSFIIKDGETEVLAQLNPCTFSAPDDKPYFIGWSGDDGKYYTDRQGVMLKAEDYSVSTTITLTAQWAAVTQVTHSDFVEGVYTISANGCYQLTTESGDTMTGQITVESSKLAVLDLNGKTLNAGEKGTVITNNGVLTLVDSVGTGKITGGKANNGGGVNNNGMFTMFGGTITENNASAGGGVYVTSGSMFTMAGGSIFKNNADSGGGVFNYDSMFTMNGGTISSNNSAVGGQGGGVNNFGGTFEMSGGTITENSASSGGGVRNSGIFTMDSGTISQNTAPNGSGGGVNNVSTFIMNGGLITENSAYWNGSGVYSSSTFSVSGDAIVQGNTNENVCLTSTSLYLAGNLTGCIMISSCPEGSFGTAASASLKGADHIIFDGTGGPKFGKIDESKNLVWSDGAEITVITLDGNGGTPSPASVTQNINQTQSFTPPSAIKEGEQLLGWFTAAAEGTKVIDRDGKLVKGVSRYTDAGGKWIYNQPVLTLHAHWTDGKAYTITTSVPSGHGTISVSPSPATAGTKVTITPIADTGYRLSTLTAKESASETAIRVAKDHTFTMPEADVTVTAVFEEIPPQRYTLSYSGNGATSGTVPASSTVDEGTEVTVSGNTGNLQKAPEGIFSFTFGGWNTKADRTGASYKAGDTISLYSNLTLYAEWLVSEEKPVDPEGKSEIEADVTSDDGERFGAKVTLGSVSELNQEEETEVADVVTGETTQEAPKTEGNEAILAIFDVTMLDENGDKVHTLSSPAKVTFRMKLPDGVTDSNIVIYHYDHGEWVVVPHEAEYDEAAGEWTISVHMNSFSPISVKYSNEKHPVIYKYEGDVPEGADPLPETEVYAPGETVMLAADPSKIPGYLFTAWIPVPINPEYDLNYFTMPAYNVTVKGLWIKLEQYTVSFDMNGHGDAVPEQLVYCGDAAAEPQKPTAKGYRFGGWYLEKECRTPYDFESPVFEDLTLYAKWTSSGSGSQGSSYWATPEPTETPTVTPTPTPTATPDVPTVTPTPTPTAQPTPEVPTVKPTASPTQAPKSPMAIAGILAGLGAAACVLAARRK